MKALVFLILILILGFLLRSGMFLHGDFLYLSDQARDLLLAKDIVIDHDLTLIGGRTGFGGLYHGALWIYMIAPLFFLTGGNPFWTLVPLFVLINMGIVLIGFFVGWKLFGKGAGLLLAFLLAISRELVNVGPVTTNAGVMPIIYLLYIFSIVKFMRGDEKYFVVSVFLIGLGFQFESAFAVLLFPLTILAIFLRKKLPKLKSFVLAGLGFALAVSTFILFDLRHNFLMTSSALRLFTNTQKPLPGYEEYANLGFRTMDRIVSLGNSFFTPLFSREVLPVVLLAAFLLLAVLIVSYRFLLKEAKMFEKEYFFLLISPFIIFGIYILYPLPLWPHYLLPIAILSSFILALSIHIIWQKPILKPLILAFIILALASPLSSAKTQLSTFREYQSGGDGSYLNQLQVAKWMISDSKNKQSSYFVYTPGVLTYGMDYLVWWLTTTNGLDQLPASKTGNTYVILYKSLEGDDVAHNFWKQNVLNLSIESEFSRTFNGGIIVEKYDLSEDETPVDPNYHQNLIFR